MRLFCFSYAGGLASAFFHWKTRNSTLDIRPIEYPGRGSRWKEPLSPTMPSLIDTIIDDIQDSLSTPYAFLGHSFGGLVSFHLALRLQTLGLPLPARVFISATRAPHIANPDRIHESSDEEFLAKLMEWDGVPGAVLESPDLLKLLLPIVRADFKIFEQTRDSVKPLPIPITVLGGLHDPKVSQMDLLGWRQYTTRSFQSRFFPGRHFFLFSSAFSLDVLSEDLQPVANFDFQAGLR